MHGDLEFVQIGFLHVLAKALAGTSAGDTFKSESCVVC